MGFDAALPKEGILGGRDLAYFYSWDYQGGIKPKEVKIVPFAGHFSRIKVQDTREAESERELFVAVDPGRSKGVRIAAIEHSDRFDDGDARVTLLRATSDHNSQSFVFRHFSTKEHRTPAVSLVAINGDIHNEGRFSWSYAISAPPILKQVTVKVDGTPIYKKWWERKES